MNKFLLLLICAALTAGQPALGADSISKMFYGSANFNRTLPGYVAGPGQQPDCLVEGVTMCAYDYGIDEVYRLAKEGVSLGSDSKDNYISLEQGNVLLNPDRDILVDTSQGTISIGSGATVFVMKAADGLVVYDVSQPKPQQVSVAVNKKQIVLESGRMLVITKQNAEDFENLNINCHTVAYSEVQPLDLDSATTKAFLANFSIPSALVIIEPFKRLTVSHNKRDKLALEKLAKNARLAGDTLLEATITGCVAGTIDKPLEVADGSHW